CRTGTSSAPNIARQAFRPVNMPSESPASSEPQSHHDSERSFEKNSPLNGKTWRATAGARHLRSRYRFELTILFLAAKGGCPHAYEGTTRPLAETFILYINVAYKTWRDVLTVAASISNKIVEAILSQQLAPEARLGESELATLFNCSRTIVREAMLDLAARGIVTVIPRRGWFLTQVDAEMARELYDARQIIETGLLRHFAQKGRPLEP